MGLTIFFSILSLLQAVSYVKVHVYCVFDYFLFNLVFSSGGELHESACLLRIWLFSLQFWLHFSRWVTWMCMFIVCLTFPLQSYPHFSRWVTWKFMFIVVSYVKVHVYCVFDYFLFNLVSTSVGELCKSACLLCVWLFSLQSCLHFRRWVTWKCMFIVSIWLYFLFNLVSTSVGELHVSACLLCVLTIFSSIFVSTSESKCELLQLHLDFRWWVTWKCMFIVCLTFFTSILSPLQSVSYLKVHVYCVFDYFLFNHVSTSVGELRESACLLRIWLFSLQFWLHFSRWVTWMCMFIVCLTFPLQSYPHFRLWVT